jgi:pimeloyl-ACP methyl ester carboxylesterase
MIQPLFEHRLKLAGFQTRVLELEGDGVPVLFFHGYADSADTWRLCLAELARRGRRAIAVDLPGFGTADRLRSQPVLAQFDTFAAAALNYLTGKEGQAIAVGNSLGGCVALRQAERRSDRLSGLVAVAPAWLEMSRLLHLVERDPLLRSLLALPSPVPRAVLETAVARLYRSLAFARPQDIDRAIVKAFTPTIVTGRRLPATWPRPTGSCPSSETRTAWTGLPPVCWWCGATATGWCFTGARGGSWTRCRALGWS